MCEISYLGKSVRVGEDQELGYISVAHPERDYARVFVFDEFGMPSVRYCNYRYLLLSKLPDFQDKAYLQRLDETWERTYNFQKGDKVFWRGGGTQPYLDFNGAALDRSKPPKIMLIEESPENYRSAQILSIKDSETGQVYKDISPRNCPLAP